MRYCEYPPSVREGCGAPHITRHWRRLGEGATWTCIYCGRQYVLHLVYNYATWDTGGEWKWEPKREDES